MRPYDKITTAKLTLKAIHLVALVLLVSCNKEPMENGQGGEQVAINLSIEVSGNVAQTRAPNLESTFPIANGVTSDIGLFYIGKSRNMLMRLTGNGTTVDMKYSYDNGVTFVNKLYITPAEYGNSVLWGYYPRTTNLTGIWIPIDLTTKAEQDDQTDILYCPYQFITKETITMKFKHVYALLEFQIKKKADGEALFTSVDVMNKAGVYLLWNKRLFNPHDGKFNNELEHGTVSTNYTTNNALSTTEYTTFRVMVPPFSTTSYNDDDIEIQFHIGATTTKKFLIKKEYLKIDDTSHGFQSGAKYTFNLIYNNASTADFELVDWAFNEEVSEPIGSLPAIIEYLGEGNATDLSGSTQASYNNLYGAGETTNGAFQTTAATAYASEKPYYKLEIAGVDAYSGDGTKEWSALQGTAADHSDNICVTTHGTGWRLPRVSELKMMYNNSISSNKMITLSGDYFSATEGDANNVWILKNNTLNNTLKSDKSIKVRCVTEKPYTYVHNFIEYVGENTIKLSGSTQASYNNLYGAGGTTNGAFQATAATAYANEKPYFKLEIAGQDAYSGDGTTNWTELQGTAADHSDNICVTTHGTGWRLPRVSELRMMYNNAKLALSLYRSFQPTVWKYLTATEVDNNEVWVLSSDNTSLDFNLTKLSKTTVKDYYVRCVKELPPPTTPTIMEYGGKNGSIPYGISGSTTVSYNNLYGSGGTTNGAFRTTAKDVYDNEKPYYKLEIAKTNLYLNDNQSWTVMQGTKANHRDNICVMTYGTDWRLPRASEVRMMNWNNESMINEGIGFVTLSGKQCSATEYDADQFWRYNDSTDEIEEYPKNNSYVVRCVRELQPPTPTIMEYGSENGYITTGMSGSTTVSYNNLYGAGGTTNGAFRKDAATVYANEKPYFKLEIAKEDAYSGDGTKEWSALQGTAADHSDNICVTTHGTGWRLPRVSELRMMYINKSLMAAENGFTPLSGSSSYWSATELDESNAWFIKSDGALSGGFKTRDYRARCVKERPILLTRTRLR